MLHRCVLDRVVVDRRRALARLTQRRTAWRRLPLSRGKVRSWRRRLAVLVLVRTSTSRCVTSLHSGLTHAGVPVAARFVLSRRSSGESAAVHADGCTDHDERWPDADGRTSCEHGRLGQRGRQRWRVRTGARLPVPRSLRDRRRRSSLQPQSTGEEDASRAFASCHRSLINSSRSVLTHAHVHFVHSRCTVCELCNRNSTSCRLSTSTSRSREHGTGRCQNQAWPYRRDQCDPACVKAWLARRRTMQRKARRSVYQSEDEPSVPSPSVPDPRPLR